MPHDDRSIEVYLDGQHCRSARCTSCGSAPFVMSAAAKK